jgi:hypothetical protein
MYAHNRQHHSLGLTRVLVACIVVSFALAAMSIAYTAGRQSGPDAPVVEVAPAR